MFLNSLNMNNMFYKYLSIILTILLSGNLFAQDIEVSGIVRDAETGESLLGATVLEKGTGNGTVTDFEGFYTLMISGQSDTLVIAYTGYKNSEILINGRTVIDVDLNVSASELDEIVVIGYGRQKKKVVTGAIASVSSEEITSTPILRAEQAMQGRTPGVQVTNLSGQPGDPPTVRIRGAGTTGNASPLYIVDGLAVGTIDYLNPGDIESIDVLKDAASAAIYGARAANGVVLITTKSGVKGKINVTYSGYYGIQNAARKIDMLRAVDYKILMNEGARNAGLSEPFEVNEISPHDTDWQEALFQSNAPIFNHELSVVGGNDKSTFASSLSYFSQQGIIGGDKSQFDRVTARINSSHKVNKKLNFGNNLAYSHLNQRGIGSNQSFNGAYSSALNLDPLTPLYETDPDILDQPPYSNEPVVVNGNGQVYGISNYIGAEVVNPIALLEIQNGGTKKDQIVGNIYGELEIIKNLKFKTSLGIDLAYVTSDNFRPLFYLNGAQLNTEKTSVNKWIGRYFSWQWENTLAYTKKIKDHDFGILVGTTANEFNFEDLAGFNADVPTSDPQNVYLNQAQDTVWTASGGATHSALFSIFGRITYDFKDKYSVTAILRRDGSSKFGANSRYGIFPSIGLAWVASDEAFLQNLGPINIMKFRASWGINGNQEIGDYQFVSTIDKSRGYTIGSGRSVGSSPSFIENADIHWEESEQFNIGADLGLFDDRLMATLDFYVKNTKDLLERIPIPAHVGNDGPVANVGSVQNKGVELALNWRNVQGKFKYSIGINGAYNKNKMTKIGNEEKVLPGATWAIAGQVTRSEEGQPIAYFWGYKTDGIFQNQNEVFSYINSDGELLQGNAVPGDVRFVDVNGDGIINEDDRTFIGKPTPDWTFGFNSSVNYKNFDFSFMFIGVAGVELFNGMQRQDLRFTNRPTSILDRWTGEGTSNKIPRYTWIDVNNNYRVSDLYIESGAFLRLRNIQLGYSVPKSLLDKIGASVWRFYISAENLLTFTNYTGSDPEIGAISSFDIGIDRAVYPHARTFRFGTSLTF
jgi:TonB-linked SusC/RagA family outer membrane protein